MTEQKVDPRESVFPNWYDLSIKYEGYETKGYFGTVHVVNSHESQKSQEKPEVEDGFVCESLDAAEEEDFELVKVAKPKEKKADDGAPKRLTRVKYIDPLSDFQAGQAQLQRRLQVLKSIKSKSVMTFRGYQEVDGNLWYMSDYFNKRSVLDESHWLGRPMKEDECCQLTIGMLRGLTYLRYRRIVHGNIKASNVFRDPATGLGILGDFRLPGIQSFDDLAKPETSLHYMSPELLLSQGAQASPKSDLWALAATICQLMTRLPPHSQMSRKELEAHPWVAGDLSPGLSHVELTGTLLSDWQNKTLIGVYAPSDAKIPGADLNRPIYKHYKNRVYIFFFEATASWQVAEMKDLGRPRAVLYCQDDVRWPQLIGKSFKGWSKQAQNWIEVEDCSIDVFYVAED